VERKIKGQCEKWLLKWCIFVSVCARVHACVEHYHIYYHVVEALAVLCKVPPTMVSGELVTCVMEKASVQAGQCAWAVFEVVAGGELGIIIIIIKINDNGNHHHHWLCVLAAHHFITYAAT